MALARNRITMSFLQRGHGATIQTHDIHGRCTVPASEAHLGDTRPRLLILPYDTHVSSKADSSSVLSLAIEPLPCLSHYQRLHPSQNLAIKWSGTDCARACSKTSESNSAANRLVYPSFSSSHWRHVIRGSCCTMQPMTLLVTTPAANIHAIRILRRGAVSAGSGNPRTRSAWASSHC